MRVDTQVHVVSPDRERYPVDPPPMDVPPWFDRFGRSAEDLAAEMQANGIDRAVLVQGYSAYRYDNRYTADAAAADPERFASACIVDLEHDPVADARYWVLERGARAIRLFLQLGDGRWVDSAAADRLFDTLASLGAVAQAAVTAEQLPGVLRAARRHRHVPVLVDHCGFPDLSGGPGYPRARALFELSDAPNVFLKLSAHVFDRAREAGLAPRDVTGALVGAFGAERIMWASDLTVQSRSYAELLADADAACAGLCERERNLVLGEAASALWWPATRTSAS